MGKQIYFTEEEINYIRLVLSNIDEANTEEEARVRDTVFDKVCKATK